MPIKHKKIMYIVKREVVATNIKSAMTRGGKIYSIEEASKEYQDTLNKPIVMEGFKK